MMIFSLCLATTLLSGTSIPKAQAAIVAPKTFSTTLETIDLVGVSFDSRNYQLRIADQPKGPASRWQNARDAGKTLHALASINASFFTPQGEPLGLVRTNSTTYGSWNSSTSLGNGIWYETKTGESRLVSRSSISAATASRYPHLLQAGPMLIVAGKASQALNREKPAMRSLLIWDGTTRWILARSGFCTLHEIAQQLAKSSRKLPFPPRFVLNLDGGSSSELWISHAIAGSDELHREFWNKPVRNFFVLVPRSS